LLETVVVGWEGIEDVFLANLAMKKPFILMGKHGICKTRVSKEIAQIYKNDTDSHFRFYDATKDDLITIAGIPIPEQLKRGKLEFSRHDRSIWEAKIIVVDELTRANKDNQNLWLEILEEHTCFGKKLVYETFISTMNPETYASTMKVDEALIDRFYAVIPVPDFQKSTAKDFRKVIDLNLDRHEGDEKREIPSAKITLEKIRKQYSKLLENLEFLEGVKDFVSVFIEVLLKQMPATELYISPRKAVQLTEEILALTATQIILKNSNLSKSLIENAAYKAVTYTLSIPLRLNQDTILNYFDQFKSALLKFSMTEADKIRMEIGNPDKEVVYAFFTDNCERIQKHLKQDEVEKLVGELNIYTHNQGSKTLDFYASVSKMQGIEEGKRKIFGQILESLNLRLRNLSKFLQTKGAITSSDDAKAFLKAKEFLGSLKTMPFSSEAVKFLLDKVPEDYNQGTLALSAALETILKGEFNVA